MTSFLLGLRVWCISASSAHGVSSQTQPQAEPRKAQRQDVLLPSCTCSVHRQKMFSAVFPCGAFHQHEIHFKPHIVRPQIWTRVCHTMASNNGLHRSHSWWSSLAQVTNKFHRLPPLPEIQELAGISKDQDKPLSSAKASQQWELLSFPPPLRTPKRCHTCQPAISFELLQDFQMLYCNCCSSIS